jgi:hypothetical protein
MSLSSQRKSVLFQRGQQLILAFRGSVLTNAEDILCNASLMTGYEGTMPRFIMASRYVRILQRRFPGHSLYLSGHSLGASVSMYCAYRNRVTSATGFNGFASTTMLAARSPLNALLGNSYSRCKLYIVLGDPIGITGTGMAARGATVVTQITDWSKGSPHGMAQFLTSPDVPLLLDKLSTATKTSCRAAFAVARLSATYAGPTLRLRRTSDSVTADFYANSDGVLGTAVNAAGTSLTTWLGSNSAVTAKWYDQSGSSNHAVQASTTQQPKLVGVTDGYVDLSFPASTANYFLLPSGTIPTGAAKAFTSVVRHGTPSNILQGSIIGAGTPTTLTGHKFGFQSNLGYAVDFWNSLYTFGGATGVAGNTIALKYDGSNLLTGYVNGVASTPKVVTGVNCAAAQQFIGYDFHNSFNTGANCPLSFVYIFGSAVPDGDLAMLCA